MNPGNNGNGRGNSGQCFHCGSKTHYKRDCPEIDKCFRCGSKEHFVRDCLFPRGYGERRPPFHGCRCCGALRHWSRECDLVKEMQHLGIDHHGIKKCRNCGQNGHWQRYCDQPARVPISPQPAASGAHSNSSDAITAHAPSPQSTQVAQPQPVIPEPDVVAAAESADEAHVLQVEEAVDDRASSPDENDVDEGPGELLETLAQNVNTDGIIGAVNLDGTGEQVEPSDSTIISPPRMDLPRRSTYISFPLQQDDTTYPGYYVQDRSLQHNTEFPVTYNYVSMSPAYSVAPLYGSPIAMYPYSGFQFGMLGANMHHGVVRTWGPQNPVFPLVNHPAAIIQQPSVLAPYDGYGGGTLGMQIPILLPKEEK